MSHYDPDQFEVDLAPWSPGDGSPRAQLFFRVLATRSAFNATFNGLYPSDNAVILCIDPDTEDYIRASDKEDIGGEALWLRIQEDPASALPQLFGYKTRFGSPFFGFILAPEFVTHTSVRYTSVP